MMKALDNQIRVMIVQFILNSSPVSFTNIHEYLQKEGGEISKGTLTYHLGLLIEGDILVKKLERGKGNEYSHYDIIEEAEQTLEDLDLIERI